MVLLGRSSTWCRSEAFSTRFGYNGSMSSEPHSPFFPDRLDSIERKLDAILALLTSIQQGEAKMAADLTALQAQVQATTTLEQSAITLINGLAAQMKAVAADPVAVAALADQLKAGAASLSAAIVANTPAQTAPTKP
jgi:hypothetical protein